MNLPASTAFPGPTPRIANEDINSSRGNFSKDFTSVQKEDSQADRSSDLLKDIESVI
jgi:hypothetical protein